MKESYREGWYSDKEFSGFGSGIDACFEYWSTSVCPYRLCVVFLSFFRNIPDLFEVNHDRFLPSPFRVTVWLYSIKHRKH